MPHLISRSPSERPVFALCRTVSLELPLVLRLIDGAAETNHYVRIGVHCCEPFTVTIIPLAR